MWSIVGSSMYVVVCIGGLLGCCTLSDSLIEEGKERVFLVCGEIGKWHMLMLVGANARTCWRRDLVTCQIR
jgi:hypothetical protein